MKFQDVSSKKERAFRVTKQIQKENKAIVGKNCIRNNHDKLSLSINNKRKARKEDCELLLNTEFSWWAEDLTGAELVSDPPVWMTREMKPVRIHF